LRVYSPAPAKGQVFQASFWAAYGPAYGPVYGPAGLKTPAKQKAGIESRDRKNPPRAKNFNLEGFSSLFVNFALLSFCLALGCQIQEKNGPVVESWPL
jgi:hypothetical protein